MRLRVEVEVDISAFESDWRNVREACAMAGVVPKNYFALKSLKSQKNRTPDHLLIEVVRGIAHQYPHLVNLSVSEVSDPETEPETAPETVSKFSTGTGLSVSLEQHMDLIARFAVRFIEGLGVSE